MRSPNGLRRFMVVPDQLCHEAMKYLGTTVPRYHLGTVVPVLRERNPLAHPTLDMYLPLSKFESIHWVSNGATV